MCSMEKKLYVKFGLPEKWNAFDGTVGLFNKMPNCHVFPWITNYLDLINLFGQRLERYLVKLYLS